MPKIREVTKHGKRRFEVDFGRVAGQRKRVYQETVKEAERKLKVLENERKRLGELWGNLETRTKYGILEALRDIKKAGLTIHDVWKYYQEHHENTGGRTVKQAVEEFLEVKIEAGRRKRTIENSKQYLNSLLGPRMDRQLSSIRSDELRKWIHGVNGGDWARHTAKKRLTTFFNWSHKMGYIEVNPANRLESISIEHTTPEILSLGQCRDLVAAAHRIDQDMLVYLALALFLGIRPDECRRLPREAVNLDAMTVTIDARTSKTRNHRIVTINEPAYKILSTACKNWDIISKYPYRLRALKKEAGIKKWPQDVLRHTAASHLYNIYGIKEATEQLGHSANVMLRHYRQMVTKDETKEWLEI